MNHSLPVRKMDFEVPAAEKPGDSRKRQSPGRSVTGSVAVNRRAGATVTNRDDYADARITVALAIGLWAGFVVLATRAQVFTRLPVEVFMALALFAVGFAVASVTVDARIRGWLDRQGAATPWTVVLAIDVLLAAIGAALAEGQAGGSFAAAPWAPIVLVGMPITVALGCSGLLGLAMRVRASASTRRAHQERAA